ncbi:hypothetical protein HDU93_009246 [Gonapodya sp. JEL0774]|nr:hypothetical protein HDU93_009246 [Gonapodya sp. JEL0774]
MRAVRWITNCTSIIVIDVLPIVGCRYDTGTKALRCGRTCDDGVTWSDNLTSCGGTPPSSGVSGALIGGIVGGIVAVIALLALGFFLGRRNKAKANTRLSTVHDGTDDNGSGLKRPLLAVEGPTYANSDVSQRLAPPSQYSVSSGGTGGTQSFVLPTMGPGGQDAGVAKPVNQVFTAVFEYAAQNMDELSLRTGDQVFVLEAYNDGWAYATASTTMANSNPTQGYVPRLLSISICVGAVDIPDRELTETTPA